MRPLAPVQLFDNLRKAIHRFRVDQVTALPVVEGEAFAGWLTQQRVAEFLASETRRPDEILIAEACEPIPAMLEPLLHPEQIVERMRESGLQMLPVAFPGGRYEGCVTLADALAAQTGRLAPARIGGMATPLGVYLTSGTVNGGAGSFGLALTGVFMAFRLWLVQMVLIYGLAYLYHVTHASFLQVMFGVLNGDAVPTSPAIEILAFLAISTAMIVGFLLVMRFGPRLAGIHAAEHQTVNAIEAGEPLTPEAVGRMSRVHPRCGTNLWGFMMLTYLGIALLSALLSTKVGRENLSLVMTFVLWYIVLVVVNWKRFGGWVQQHLTTRPAKARELASGIRAGEELLGRHLAAGGLPPRPWQRIWNMGLAQVLIGAIVATALLNQIGLALDELVRSLVK